MAHNVPSDYSHHQQADAEAIKRAQEFQQKELDAEKARQDREQQADRDRRAREADEGAQGDRTTQGR